VSDAIYCLSCGYDLRGSRTSDGACPECGQRFDLRNPRTYARSLYDVWPTTEFKFVLVTEIASLVIVFGFMLLTRLGLSDAWNAVMLIGCLSVFAVLVFRCFILIYSWLALAIGFRRVPPNKRLLFTAVMLSPTLITGAFWLWIEMRG
jgi:predicted RNA-binding Zn-ribbon protein involved in translation (DUF1610 family)